MQDIKKILFIDKDWTLVRPNTPGEIFVQNPSDQCLMPGVLSALGKASEAGWTPIIVSNQGGVWAEFKTLAEAQEEMEIAMHMTGLGYSIFCPTMGEEARVVEFDETTTQYNSFQVKNGEQRHPCDYRKPGTGMLRYWFARFNRDEQIEKALMVGDMLSDKEAAEAFGIDFMWSSQWVAEGLPDAA